MRACTQLALAAVMMGVATSAAAVEACKMTMLKTPAIKLDEVLGIAEKHAKAWAADAVIANLGNTSLGPLQPDGSSKAWNLRFYSAATKSNMAVSTMNGMLTCWADPGPSGRIPDLKPGFTRDGAKLYAYAKQHGDKLIADGYDVMIQTAASPSTNHATWYIGYSKDSRSGPVTVIVDANTGAVEKVLK